MDTNIYIYIYIYRIPRRLYHNVGSLSLANNALAVWMQFAEEQSLIIEKSA